MGVVVYPPIQLAGSCVTVDYNPHRPALHASASHGSICMPVCYWVQGVCPAAHWQFEEEMPHPVTSDWASGGGLVTDAS
ncbi:hypothetical protein chiPu_0000316 [Chiloscyllium punctatum]|uniref:Uncharacterized protein n=1 Tax=Chiloscyllium punctatum TaxID=137246 RepID=A0A401RUY4_CHIPU|nr:hypothetical protein [Chiloscyllium punctatum]